MKCCYQYIQNIYSIVKFTYPFVQTKREIEMLKLLLRGAISYENKEKRNLLEYYLLEMYVTSGEQQTIYKEIKKAAYTPFVTHSNFQAIGRVLILDLIMGTEFPNEYPWDK